MQVDAALGYRVEAVLGIQGNPHRCQLFHTQRVGEFCHEGPADQHGIAPRLPVRINIGQGYGISPVPKADLAAVPQAIQGFGRDGCSHEKGYQSQNKEAGATH